MMTQEERYSLHDLYVCFGRGEHFLSKRKVKRRGIEREVEDFKARGWIRLQWEDYWLTREGAKAVATWWIDYAKRLNPAPKVDEKS
jgi:hypothetical protein